MKRFIVVLVVAIFNLALGSARSQAKAGLAGLLFGLIPTIENEDWSQFRGKAGRGIDSSTSKFPGQLDTDKTLRWKVSVPPGHSSPIVVRDSVIITGHEDHRLLTQSLNLDNGSLIWQKELPVPKIEKVYHHGAATPTAVSDGNLIYCFFGSFGVIAYDLQGQEAWRYETNLADNLYGTAASPILVGEQLLVLLSDQKTALLVSLNKATGQVLWKHEGKGPASSWSTPAVWPAENPQIVLIYEPFHLRAISIESGKEFWSIPGLADEPIAIPQIEDDLLVVTSYNMRTNREVIGLPTYAEILKECDSDQDGMLTLEESKKNKSVLSRPDADGEGDHPLSIFFRMLDANKDGRIDESEWPRLQAWVDSFEHANGFVALRLEDAQFSPEVAWRTEPGVPECPASLLFNRKLFAIRNGGVVTCLDAVNGNILFRERAAPGGPYYASPVLADNKIYLASARGELAVLEAQIPFRLLSKLKLDEDVWATPALSKGRVIVRSAQHLWLFEDRSDKK